MNNISSTGLYAVLVIFVIQVVAVLWIRNKFPLNIKAGCIACLIAPGVGQFYIETKMSVVFFLLVYGLVWNPLGSFISNPYLLYFITGCISSGLMYLRLTKKPEAPIVPSTCKECGSKLNEEMNKCSSCGATLLTKAEG